MVRGSPAQQLSQGQAKLSLKGSWRQLLHTHRSQHRCPKGPGGTWRKRIRISKRRWHMDLWPEKMTDGNKNYFSYYAPQWDEMIHILYIILYNSSKPHCQKYRRLVRKPAYDKKSSRNICDLWQTRRAARPSRGQPVMDTSHLCNTVP